MHRSTYQVLMSFGNKQWLNINEFLRKRSFMLEFMQWFVPLHPIQYSIENVYRNDICHALRVHKYANV